MLGDFAVKAAESGFVIAPAMPLELGSWKGQGHPFLAAGAKYTQSFDVPEPSGRYRVALPAWYGSVAKVSVNGKPAGHIGYRPWQRDVSRLIRPGRNTIQVTVIGTLKNTLGPHHGNPGTGRAWPHMFRVAPETGPPPGANYHTLEYGLFEPFELRHTTK